MALSEKVFRIVSDHVRRVFKYPIEREHDRLAGQLHRELMLALKRPHSRNLSESAKLSLARRMLDLHEIGFNDGFARGTKK
ncbi:TPA: hypothetical protein HA244_01625 [Candidatus Micrarchaeota archaeon]|nr:hypothetical protein [Candidatus Micrarchaeota archaeon]